MPIYLPAEPCSLEIVIITPGFDGLITSLLTSFKGSLVNFLKNIIVKELDINILCRKFSYVEKMKMKLKNKDFYSKFFYIIFLSFHIIF